MLKLRIAKSPEELERGLMFVRNMPDDEGMLFDFHSPRRLSFWGKNTFIPLDVAFIDSNHIVRKISHIKPHCLSSVSCDIPCVSALEVNAGWFARHDIKVGVCLKVDSGFQGFKSSRHSTPLYVATFHNNEGHFASREKDNKSISSNMKLGQLDQDEMMKVAWPWSKPQPKPQASPEQMNQWVKGLEDLTTPVVHKRNEESVGLPIGDNQAEQVSPNDLPVFDVSDIGSKLEDSFDEVDNEEPMPEGKLNSPTEQVPGFSGEETVTEEEKEEPEKEYPIFDNAFAASEWATKNNEVMRIGYTTRRGRQLVRDIEPHGQFHSQSTHRQILVTFDETVGDIRAYIIRNIGQWSFVGQQFDKKFVVRG